MDDRSKLLELLKEAEDIADGHVVDEMRRSESEPWISAWEYIRSARRVMGDRS